RRSARTSRPRRSSSPEGRSENSVHLPRLRGRSDRIEDVIRVGDLSTLGALFADTPPPQPSPASGRGSAASPRRAVRLISRTPHIMKIYLAGPDVFLPDAVEIGRRKAVICAAHGVTGLYPLDNAIDLAAADASLQIFAGNE